MYPNSVFIFTPSSHIFLSKNVLLMTNIIAFALALPIMSSILSSPIMTSTYQLLLPPILYILAYYTVHNYPILMINPLRFFYIAHLKLFSHFSHTLLLLSLHMSLPNSSLPLDPSHPIPHQISTHNPNPNLNLTFLRNFIIRLPSPYFYSKMDFS